MEQQYFDINDFNPEPQDQKDFDYGDAHREMMLAKITERKAMFSRFVANKGKLNDIKKRGLLVKDENEKNKLREEYKKIEAEQKEWTDLITELKKKDTRKQVFREYSPYIGKNGLVYRLLEFNNYKNLVTVISESATPPVGWNDKNRSLTVEN